MPSNTNWPVDTDLQTLTDMAVPLFIFAATVCRFVAAAVKLPITSLRQRLAAILSQEKSSIAQMALTYHFIPEAIEFNTSDTKEMEQFWQTFRIVIRSIVILAESLSVTWIFLCQSCDNIWQSNTSQMAFAIGRRYCRRALRFHLSGP